MNLHHTRIMVTGEAGFLGRHVVHALQQHGCREIMVPRRRQYDLTRQMDVERLYRELGPEVVIHLAAVVGGIGANRANPGRFAYENLLMGTMLMEVGRLAGVEKFVGIGTICSYPKCTPVPFREAHLWNGYPEETNAPYGLAKKMLLVQGQAYRQQDDFNAIHLLPVNLYGPGDSFDSASSHVIPALMRKCLEAIDAGQSEITCWGDGTPTREFLYVEDCAEAIVLATAGDDGAEPVNLGSGVELSIKELVEVMALETGFRSRITWDTSQPNGQPRRCVETERAGERFGFRARTDFRTGVRRMVAWYDRVRGEGVRSEGSEVRSEGSGGGGRREGVLL